MIYVPAAMREAPVPLATSQIILCNAYLLDLTLVSIIYILEIILYIRKIYKEEIISMPDYTSKYSHT